MNNVELTNYDYAAARDESALESFIDIIDIWPAIVILAADMGVEQDTVSKWKKRNRISKTRWPDLLLAAKKRKFSLTKRDLDYIASL